MKIREFYRDRDRREKETGKPWPIICAVPCQCEGFYKETPVPCDDCPFTVEEIVIFRAVAITGSLISDHCQRDRGYPLDIA